MGNQLMGNSVAFASASVARPFAMKKNVVMRYVQTFHLNAGLGVADYKQFRASSIFDPEHVISAFGHQPMGHDQWSSFYNHYRVMKATISVNFIAEGYGSAAGADRSIGGVLLMADDITPPTNPERLMEQSLCRWATVGPSTSGKYPVVTNVYNPKTLFGLKDATDDDLLEANFGTNPSRDPKFVVWSAPVVSSGATPGNADPVDCVVTIQYHCLLTNPKDLPLS